MHNSHLQFIATLVAAALARSSQSPPPTSNTCSTVELVTSSYFQNYDPIRISPGVACTNATAAPNYTCPLQAWAYVEYSTRFNLSFADNAQRADLIDLLAPQEEDPLQLARDGIDGVVANETLLVPRGYSAYVQFAEQFSCETSFLSGCEGSLSFLSDNYVEACYPTYNTGNGSVPMFYNGRTLSFVDPETARSLKGNPYGVNESGHEAPKNMTRVRTDGLAGSGVPQQDVSSAGDTQVSALVVAAAVFFALL